MRQHRLADGGRIGRHAAADAHVDAEPHEAGLDALDIDEVGAVGHGDRGGLDRVVDELAQQGAGERRADRCARSR